MRISKNTYNLLLLLVIAFFLSGCLSAPVKNGKNTGATQISDDKYMTIDEANNAMPELAVSERETAQIEKDDDMPSTYTASSSSSKERKIVSGYRIQLYTTKDKDEAEKLKAEYEEALEETVYLIYDAPYFKLRVGNCEDEADCEELLSDVLRKGFDGAWTVRDKVTIGDDD